MDNYEKLTFDISKHIKNLTQAQAVELAELIDRVYGMGKQAGKQEGKNEVIEAVEEWLNGLMPNLTLTELRNKLNSLKSQNNQPPLAMEGK